MINFYNYYNKPGLDNESYKTPITILMTCAYEEEIGVMAFKFKKDLDTVIHLIKKDQYWAYLYAKDIIKGRWIDIEPLMMDDPLYMYQYAKYVIKGRWFEAEPYIMKTPDYAYHYAKNVIGGRWPESEPYIMKEFSSALYYAIDVIKGRWLEYEPTLKTNESMWKTYTKYLLK